MQYSKSDIQIYTDGSCHTQQKVGGWAAIILNDDEEVTLKGHELDTTHNRMELLSVIKAIEYLIKQNLTAGKVQIFSDSQYVVGIEDRIKKFKRNDFTTKSGNSIQNKDLVMQLIEFIETINPEFIKVKAHQKKTTVRNINREVDKLSRKIVRDYVKKMK